MVVAMLVTPAATAQLLVIRFDRLMVLAVVLSPSSRRSCGMYISFYLNLASGASIVLVETLLFAIALVFSPKSGWVMRRADRPRRRLRVGQREPEPSPTVPQAGW